MKVLSPSLECETLMEKVAIDTDELIKKLNEFIADIDKAKKK